MGERADQPLRLADPPQDPANSLRLVTTIRLRRVASRWPWWRRYEIELSDENGEVVAAKSTTSPSAFLVKKAGVHSTDSWDWIRAADESFEQGVAEWVSDPYPTMNTPTAATVDLPPPKKPWFRPDPKMAERLLVEARREIKPGRQLDGVGLVECIAKCEGCDDAVFRCADGSFARIHLSWATDEQPPWPDATHAGGYLAVETIMDQHEH